MIFFINKIALSLYLVSFALFCSADVTTITLKSARAVKAEITEQPSLKAIQVAVQFLPVTSLDALNNEKMNSVIARFFVEDALSQFYKKGKTVNFTFLKPIIEKTTTQKNAMYILSPLQRYPILL
ncbi:MAG: hypothetical protein E7044_04710 [Lentisphaerae bacterium]|nr:hypothetical protein [Lentisphaerota bacterium]